MSQEFEIKRLSLEEQRDRLQQQLDNLKEELSAKLNMANQEVRRTKPKPSSWRAMAATPLNPVLSFAGVPPPGAGAGGRAEPWLSSDADQLPEGDPGEAQDRVRRDEIPCPRNQQPADWPAGEDDLRLWRLLLFRSLSVL